MRMRKLLKLNYLLLKSNMEELILELKTKILEALKDGLGLDSIDALELMLLLEKNYGIKLKSPAEGKEIFKSVRTMAEYVSANRIK